MHSFSSHHFLILSILVLFVHSFCTTVYNASKYAVRGFTEAARHDLADTPIRVTHISPGMVGNTEFSNVRLGDDKKASQGLKFGVRINHYYVLYFSLVVCLYFLWRLCYLLSYISYGVTVRICCILSNFPSVVWLLQCTIT